MNCEWNWRSRYNVVTMNSSEKAREGWATRQTEINAYEFSVHYSLKGNEPLNLGYCGLGKPCEFRVGMAPTMIDNMINQLLDDPQNGYKDLDKKLYPQFP